MKWRLTIWYKDEHKTSYDSIFATVSYLSSILFTCQRSWFRVRSSMDHFLCSHVPTLWRSGQWLSNELVLDITPGKMVKTISMTASYNLLTGIMLEQFQKYKRLQFVRAFTYKHWKLSDVINCMHVENALNYLKVPDRKSKWFRESS